MKKIILLLLLAAPGTLFAQATNYEIKGKLIDVDVPMVYLSHGEGGKPVVDSAIVTNHTYILKGLVSTGQVVSLTSVKFGGKAGIPPENAMAYIFISPETFSVTHTGAFKNTTITGSPANKAYMRIAGARKPYFDKVIALNDKVSAALKSGDTIATGEIRARIDTLMAEMLEKVYGDFLRKNPKSPLALWALQFYGGTGHAIDGQKLKPFFDRLPEDVKSSAAGKEYGRRIDAAIIFDTKSVVGAKAMDFVLSDTAGKQIRLSDFKGKYVLLDFWASWCHYCRVENPHLVTTYKKFHEKGFDILSISLDVQSYKSAWLKAIHKDGLTAWAHVADLDNTHNTAAVLYGIQGIPQNFLIGPDGVIVGKNLMGEELDKKLASLFN